MTAAQRVGREGRELVQVDDEVPAIRFHHFRPAVGGDLETGQQQRPEERGVGLADLPLGEVDEQHLPIVHDLADRESAPGRGEDPRKQGIGHEGPHFVLDRGNRLGP